MLEDEWSGEETSGHKQRHRSSAWKRINFALQAKLKIYTSKVTLKESCATQTEHSCDAVEILADGEEGQHWHSLTGIKTTAGRKSGQRGDPARTEQALMSPTKQQTSPKPTNQPTNQTVCLFPGAGQVVIFSWQMFMCDLALKKYINKGRKYEKQPVFLLTPGWSFPLADLSFLSGDQLLCIQYSCELHPSKLVYF